jgi:hypothetical protein
MEDKSKKIEFVKEKLSKKEKWNYDLFRETTDDEWTAFTVNWSNENGSHYMDNIGKNKGNFALFIGGGSTVFTEDKLGRSRSKDEAYDLKVTKENAEDLICILEAFLEVA